MIKPENKLRIGAYGHYDQLNGESAKMRVRAYSINQTVYGGELNIPILYTNLKLSAVWTTPDEKYTDDFTPESYENYQFETDLNSERHLMASIYFPFDDGEFELNYISSSRKLVSKARRRSEGSEDVFSDELRFVNGIGLLFKRDFTDNFSFFTKWMVDAGRADQLIKSEASYNLQQKYQFTMGAQFLNVPDDESFGVIIVQTIWFTEGFLLSFKKLPTKTYIGRQVNIMIYYSNIDILLVFKFFI